MRPFNTLSELVSSQHRYQAQPHPTARLQQPPYAASMLTSDNRHQLNSPGDTPDPPAAPPDSTLLCHFGHSSHPGAARHADSFLRVNGPSTRNNTKRKTSPSLKIVVFPLWTFVLPN
ncbi:hypothetical protein GWI33_011374 [Rhynchophorus ferrugineus]|uniref:Uncharacterized protein n=1 Tax=Rhynchophorus ferrugineus TaxID=354439 RepID=A0A834IKJ9_RHYFE|nr:hypothetical protein GWI33_011374 [Rhynchophorus ferrugineus]